MYKFLNYLIASVWFINGLFCKILELVPRHQQIVARVVGSHAAGPFTIIIGILEIVMAIWIVSRFRVRLNTGAQIIIILSMNIIEYLIAQDLLLWGKLNFIFAIIFCVIIWWNYYLYRKSIKLA